MTKIYTLGKLAKHFDVSTHRVAYALRTRGIKSDVWAGVARVYTSDHLPAIRKALEDTDKRGRNRRLS